MMVRLKQLKHVNNQPDLEMYYRSDKDGFEDIKRTIHHKFDKKEYDETQPSHYMTVVGYVEYIGDDNSIKYLLKVISWGRVYYIRYDDFEDGLNLFNNILEIK